MSILDSSIESILGDSACQNESCGHKRSDHDTKSSNILRPCTKCNCVNFEIITISNLQNLTLVEPRTTLNQQIEQLENELEESVKEIGILKKKLKKETSKKEEYQDMVKQLTIDLEIANSVKRNLKNIIDNQGK